MLDIETINITGSSHDYDYEVKSEDVVVLAFKFNNINLPDSTTNNPESNGFISFSISPIAGITPGTAIENFADIYFDFNSAIRTNTAAVITLDTVIKSNKSITVTEGEIVLKDNTELLNISIFPNPANDHITINGANELFNQVNIFDITGKLLLEESLTSSKQDVNISDLASGIYFIEIKNDVGEKYSFKMVKE